MKKLISLALVMLIALMAFSGCTEDSSEDSSELHSAIKKAFKKTEDLSSVEFYTCSEMSFGEEAADMNTIKTVSETIESNIGKNEKYEMSNETEMFINDVSNSTYETYYKNGYYYTDRYMGSFKTKIDAKELRSENDITVPLISVEDMKSLEVKTDSKYTYSLATNELEENISVKGCKIIDFSCKNSLVRKHIEEALENNGTEFAEVEVIAGKGKYVINKKGYLVSASLEMQANVISDGGSDVTAVRTVVDYVDPGKKTDPFDPEEDVYTEINNLEDIAFLNSSMSTALSSSKLYVTMDGSAEIVSEGNDEKAGYEREYIRKYSSENEEYFQETKTKYVNGEELSDAFLSGSYYTDGTYYSASDVNKLYIKSAMDFPAFSGVIYAAASTTPADMFAPGMMKSITKKEKGKEFEFSFELNPESEGGIKFIGSLFGPYSETFGGDIESAEKQVKSFKATSYVDENGVYYKTQMTCDILLKFEEGDVQIKAEQVVNVIDGEKMGVIEFPKFEGYENMDSSALLSGYASVGG